MSNVVKAKAHKRQVNQLSKGWNAALTIFFTILAVVTIIPLVLVICISLSSAESLTYNGYRFIPEEWTTAAYTSLIQMGGALPQAYKMTIFYAFFGTALSLFVMSMLAYVLARKDFKYRTPVSFYIFFTTLFSGGLVPSYVLNVRYLHLNDTIWIFLLPGLVSAFDVIILRTFVQTSVPDSLFESAKLDGANDFQTYFYILLPLFKAGLATIGLFNVVAKWNDWFTGLLYVEDKKLVPIMTVLQQIQKAINYLTSQADNNPDAQAALDSLPGESARMALAMFAIFPLLIAYPFFQKYFVKGLTVGSVKG